MAFIPSPKLVILILYILLMAFLKWSKLGQLNYLVCFFQAGKCCPDKRSINTIDEVSYCNITIILSLWYPSLFLPSFFAYKYKNRVLYLKKKNSSNLISTGINPEDRECQPLCSRYST